MYLVTCDEVYNQIKYWKNIFREELLEKGHEYLAIERVLQVAEKKIKDFMAKVTVESTFPNQKYPDVKNFFGKFIGDERMIKLMQRKKSPTPMPEDSDMQIFAKSLNLPNLWFTTTDGHFRVLTSEIEEEFKINIVTDDNGFRKQDELDKLLS